MTDTTFLPVASIEAPAETQVRVRLDPQAIDEYAEAMRNGDVFPALVVFAEKGSERYVLADGRHRILAAEKAGLTDFHVDIQEGDIHAAMRYALGINAQHGVRRTNADKVKTVAMALADPFFDEMSLREVASFCRVSHELVRDGKKLIAEADGTSPEPSVPDSSAAGNTRITSDPPSQAEIDRSAFLLALSEIRTMPFSGNEGPDKMELQPDDYAAVNFCAEWLGSCADKMEENHGD